MNTAKFPSTKAFALGTASCIAQSPKENTNALPCLILMCLSGPGLVISGVENLVELKVAIDFALSKNQTEEQMWLSKFKDGDTLESETT